MKELVAHLGKWTAFIVLYAVFIIGCVYLSYFVKQSLLYGKQLVYVVGGALIFLNIGLLFHIALALFPPDDIQLTHTAKLMRKAFTPKSHQDGELSMKEPAIYEEP